MKTITEKAAQLIDQHASLCAVSREDFYAGVRYTPEFCYEYDTDAQDTVFNQPFHELMLQIGVVDSSQSPEERQELGQRYVIDTKTLMKYANMAENNST